MKASNLEGRHMSGCNYWASHAGTEMWKDWREDVVRKDLKALSEAGLSVLRVFPLWRDFQPLELQRTFHSLPREIRMSGGAPLPETERGRAGVSEEAMARFKAFSEMAAENGMKLIVSLVTGWMSGRLFAPPAFEGLNPISDPLAVRWEIAFVRHFVKSFKSDPAILAWELGNECNCMGKAASREEAWGWTNSIASAIRLEDPSRSVASGMHGLYPESKTEFNEWDPRPWTIQDQGELTDLMCAHPYPHSPSKKAARVDPVGSMRSSFQAVVEARLYGDIGGKPAMVEEIGTFGPMVCDETSQASFLRNVLFNTWAHGSLGLLWWCAFDQSHLSSTPYDWNAWERELGLLRPDYSRKPLCGEFAKFEAFLKSLPVDRLPSFRRDAVCVLTRGMGADETLSNAWSSFLLAKQAGFDLEFQFANDALKESSVYIVPGVKGAESMPLSLWRLLQERVEKGAVLYVSLDDGHLAPFNDVFGLAVETRQEREAPARFSLGGRSFVCQAPYKLGLRCEGAEAIASEEDGNPVLTRFKKGSGEVWLTSLPIEKSLGAKPGAFDEGAAPFHAIYSLFASKAIGSRALRRSCPQISVTEHEIDEKKTLAVLVNNSGKEARSPLELLQEVRVAKAFPEEAFSDGSIELGPREGAALLLETEA